MSLKVTTWFAPALLAMAYGCDGNAIAPDRNDQQTTLTTVKKGKVFEVLWRVALVSHDLFSDRFQNRSTPQVSSDGKFIVVGTSDGAISCLFAHDGRLRWKFRTEGPSDVSPLLTDDRVYFTGGDSHVHALRLSNGKEIWKSQLARNSSVTPVLYEKLLLVQTDGDELVCLDAESGEWRWSYKQQEISGERFRVAGAARPLACDGSIFASFSDGTLVKLSAKDGSVISRRNLRGERDRFWDSDVDILPIGELVIAGSFGQGLFGLSPGDLTTRWQVKIEGPSDVSVDGDKVYFTTSDSDVVSVSIDSGSIAWQKKIEKGGLLSRPVVAGRWLLVSSEELSLVALDKISGETMQVFNPGKGSSAAAGIFRDRAWWISNGETLYAMAVAN